MFQVVYMLDIAKLEHFPPSRLDRIFLLHHIILICQVAALNVETDADRLSGQVV
jgi:hypothetical protein